MLTKNNSSEEFRSGLSLRVAQGILSQRYRDKNDEPGSPFLWFLSFGEAKERD
jgi:hypothetical protein